MHQLPIGSATDNRTKSEKILDWFVDTYFEIFNKKIESEMATTRAITNELTETEMATIFGLYPLAPCLIYDSLEDPTEGFPDNIQGVYFHTKPCVWCENVKRDPATVKLVLTPIHHLTPSELIHACMTYDRTGFIATAGQTISPPVYDPERHVSRLVLSKEFSYTIDMASGAIAFFKGGRQVSVESDPVSVAQFYFRKHVAVPLYFEPGHWANGKNAFDVGRAIPSLHPLTVELNRIYHKDRQAVIDWLNDAKLNNVGLEHVSVVDRLINELKQKPALPL